MENELTHLDLPVSPAAQLKKPRRHPIMAIRPFHKVSPRALHYGHSAASQGMIIRADILIMPVLHPKPFRNRSELDKTKPFIEMPCVDI